MTDRIGTLVMLERLARHALEAEARELAALRAHVSQLQRNRADLLGKLKSEARVVILEAAPYVGSYIRAIRNEVAYIDRAIAKAQPRLDTLEAAMAEQFREIKTINLALDRARKQQQQARDHREAAETDMLTLIRLKRVDSRTHSATHRMT